MAHEACRRVQNLEDRVHCLEDGVEPGKCSVENEGWSMGGGRWR